MNSNTRNQVILRGLFFLPVLIATCLLVSSCSASTKSIEQAEQNVEQFHTQLNTEQFAAVYAAGYQ
jgi:hypothetical protein